MRARYKNVVIALLVLGGAMAQASHAQAPQPAGVIIENVRIFNGSADRLSAPMNVLVVGNVIKTISTTPIAAPPASTVTRIQGGGRTLMPGMSDMHVHIFMSASSQAELMDSKATFETLEAKAAAPGPAVGFALPATFAGVMPCADCAGIAETLTLRADGLYRLRRTYLDKPDGPFAELGRWIADASGRRLTLRSGSEILLFEVKDNETLRLLDRLGQPITSNANLDLRRTAQVEPISELLRWRGEFRYLADSATFTDCASGLHWPVAMTADYLAMERNYLQSRSAPAEPLLVSFEGRLEVRPAMEGPPREQMVVDRFGSSQPGASCGSAASGKGDVMAELKDTYWKLIELDGATVVMAPAQQREVRITLAGEGSRLIGFSGCNQLVGAYVQDGNALRFTQMAGTRMACVEPLMELESQVLKMLGATTGYRIEGEQLTLLGGEQVLARFEPVQDK
jgi:heat shock protein HslJ/uncharacterized lipoprotein NlpE involved in copper resistance